jgi:peptidoglycan hydrolase CwlO-like protein
MSIILIFVIYFKINFLFMSDSTLTPQDYQKFCNNLPKTKQEILYRLDEEEAYELYGKNILEQENIKKVNSDIESLEKIIAELKKVKQQSQAIIEDITGKPISV